MHEPPGTWDLPESTPPPRRKTDIWGVVSLCVGLCTLLLPVAMCIFPPLVVTCGIVSIVRIRQEPETLKGLPIAIAGTLLGAYELVVTSGAILTLKDGLGEVQRMLGGG